MVLFVIVVLNDSFGGRRWSQRLNPLGGVVFEDAVSVADRRASPDLWLQLRQPYSGPWHYRVRAVPEFHPREVLY